MLLRPLLVFLFAFLHFGTAYSQNLTETSRVSLITCGQGDDLYATFGHSAIHIFDSRLGIDKVYNYGTFDFDTPNFYVKFAQGKLNYQLAVTSFDRFIRAYEYEGRWVYRQDFDLTENEKTALYTFLETNALPENKDYKYDFFYDNCSTRIRDAFEKVLGKKLTYPTASQDTTATFRQMIDLYLTDHPWSDIGIDLALGVPCDKEADFREKMFLPDYLMTGFDEARVDRDGELVPIVSQAGFVLAENPEVQAATSGIQWIFWTLFILCAIATIFVNPQLLRWLDIFFFGIAGFLGIVVLLLWFATDHSATKLNLNVLWALPSWLYGAYLLILRKDGTIFFKVHATILFFVMISWPWIPQRLNPAMIPVVLALLARSWAWQKHRFLNQPNTYAA